MQLYGKIKTQIGTCIKNTYNENITLPYLITYCKKYLLNLPNTQNNFVLWLIYY